MSRSSSRELAEASEVLRRQRGIELGRYGCLKEYTGTFIAMLE